jgi:hypothetical protein
VRELSNLPKVKIVDRSLLISHVDVERKEINRREGTPAQNLKQSWQAIPVKIRLRRWCVLVRHGERFIAI